MAPLTRRTPPARDDGAILLIVLLFVGVVGLLSVAITEQVRVSVGNTLVVRSQQALVSAANAGIDHGIQKVRTDSTACLNGVSTLPAPPAVDGKTVSVTCEYVSGNASGVLGYAAVTTDTLAPSLVTSGGGKKMITGPVFSARVDDMISNLVVSNGDLIEKQGGSSCNIGDAAPGGVTVQPNGLFSYQCKNVAIPSFTDALPSTAITTLGVPNTVNSKCEVFTPNRKYTGVIDITTPAYFGSGTYYFEDAAVTIGKGASVVGGSPGAEHPVLGLTPCATDGAVLGSVGSGVKWIFGGTSTLSFSASGAATELFSRRGGDDVSDGTLGVVISQVQANPTPPSGWVASTLLPANDLLFEGAGSQPSVAIHGIVDARTAGVNVNNASNTSQAQFQGGILAGRLTLQNAASSGGLAVNIDTDDKPRVVRLVSTASSAAAGDKKIVSTAVIQLQNNSSVTATVLSWRTSS